MSLLKEIQEFQASGLRKTDTVVMTTDGSRLLEQKTDSGGYTQQNIGQDLGFVGDMNPDTQIGAILPGLLLGSQDAASDKNTLEKLKVTHILCTATGIEPSFPDSYEYKTIEVLDLPDTSINKYFPECFEFINTALDNNGCVLVHCNAGVSRSAAIVIAYMMKYKDMDFQQAFDHVKSQRPAIQPNIGFLIQLKEYKPNKD